MGREDVVTAKAGVLALTLLGILIGFGGRKKAQAMRREMFIRLEL